jgi:hypothetical protein
VARLLGLDKSSTSGLVNRAAHHGLRTAALIGLISRLLVAHAAERGIDVFPGTAAAAEGHRRP